MKKNIEKQIMDSVKETLAEIDIDGIITYETSKVKDIVKSEIRDIVIKKISDELMFMITKAVKIKLMKSDPIIERRVLEILAEEFNL